MASRRLALGKRQVKMPHVLSIIAVLTPIEAQRMSGVPPLIRAHRPKILHPVYEIVDYRMRHVAEGRGQTPQRDFR
jgi:hypothetical protein